jgi:hypothetical protein
VPPIYTGMEIDLKLTDRQIWQGGELAAHLMNGIEALQNCRWKILGAKNSVDRDFPRFQSRSRGEFGEALEPLPSGRADGCEEPAGHRQC